MIPLPLRDENPTSRFPAVTVFLIVANSLVWLLELGRGVTATTLDYGVIPAWLLAGRQEGPLDLPQIGTVFLHQEVPPLATVLTSMFLHGGWAHLIGNMWFLWIFGDNVEDALGRVRYLAFYLVSGMVAAGAQVIATPGATAPMVGASGAIAGVLGGYLVLYPRARVKCLWILIVFITTIYVPAWALLGIWFFAQFLVPQVGEAWMAHVGGFLFGVASARLLARPRARAFP
jgi:membrane associated rhomboid family serine protease